ncbi:MAG: hypothetical protein KGI82_01035 [Betaproteobacteria bacterium]|nr:hypothetical protein [Betaproteobacteria bacterium]
MKAVAAYIKRVLIALDMLGSALLLGKPDETISGRTGRAELAGKWWGRVFAPPIDVFMHLCGAYPHWRGHCLHAILGDTLRAEAAIKADAAALPIAAADMRKL